MGILALLFIRFCLAGYLIGTTIMLLVSLARTIFHDQPAKQLGKDILFLTIWPLSLFSKKGRENLIARLPKL